MVSSAAIHGRIRGEDADPVGGVAPLAFSAVAVSTVAAVGTVAAVSEVVEVVSAKEVVAVATLGSSAEGELPGKSDSGDESDSDDKSMLVGTADCIDGQFPEAELSFMLTIILPASVNEKRTPLHICTEFSYIRRMTNVVQLQSFKSVATTGSVRSAALHLGLSPSAVSHHLKLLEQDSGLTLFQRQGRGLCLTDTGSAIMGEVDGVLDSSSRLQQRITDLKDSRVNRLSISYFSSAGNRWMPELVLFLEHRHPHTAVQLSLAEGQWHESRSDIQIVITETREPALPPQINCSFLLEDPYVVAVPEGHELATRSEVSLTEIERLPWIDNEQGDGPCRTILFDACARAGIRVQFKHEAHTFVAALHMVSRGLGVTLLPRLGIDQLPEGVVIVPLAAPEPIRYVHAISDPDHPQQDAIDDALTALRELASSDAVALA